MLCGQQLGAQIRRDAWQSRLAGGAPASAGAHREQRHQGQAARGCASAPGSRCSSMELHPRFKPAARALACSCALDQAGAGAATGGSMRMQAQQAGWAAVSSAGAIQWRAPVTGVPSPTLACMLHQCAQHPYASIRLFARRCVSQAGNHQGPHPGSAAAVQHRNAPACMHCGPRRTCTLTTQQLILGSWLCSLCTNAFGACLQVDKLCTAAG